MSSFKGWKKVKSEKDHTVMRDQRGHELKIAHSALSPKMRGQLAEIPVHEEEEPQKMSNGGEAKLTGAQQRQSIVDAYEGKKSNIEHAEGGKRIIQSPKSDPQGDAIKSAQEANKADPSKAGALKKINAARAKFLGLYDGGDVNASRLDEETTLPPDEIIPGVPSSASQPAVFDFNEKKAGLAQSMAGNYPTPEALDAAVTDKALQSVESSKKQEAVNQAQSDAQKTAAYNQTVELNKRLEAQGLPPKPLPDAPGMAPDPASEGMNAAPEMAPAEQPAAPAAPGLASGINMQPGGGSQAAGIRAEANAMGALGKEQAAIQQQALEKQQKVQFDVEEKQKFLMDEFQNAIQDVKDGHIDPNHYMGSLSTGGKIATAIGLIMGGLGGAGKDNPALGMLNKLIDNDIEAQKANLGKKEHLVGMFDKQLNNIQTSATMARAMMQEQAITQLKIAEAKAQDPIAKARAQQAIGALQAQQAAALKPTAVAMQVDQLQKAINADPARGQEYLDQIRLLDPKAVYTFQSRFVPGMGLASDRASAEKMKEYKAAMDGAKVSVKKLQEINERIAKNPLLKFDPETRKEADVVANGLIGLLRVPYTGPGAMNEGEKALLSDITSNPTKVWSLSSSNRAGLKALSKDMDNKLNQAAIAHGLRPMSPTAGLTPQQKAFYDFAKKNPNDKRSPMILKKLGVD